MGKTTIFFLPSLTIQNREEQYGRPVEGAGAPATQAIRTAGMLGKTERRLRATHSAPNLGRGRTVEGDRRRRAVFNREGTGGAGGGDGGLGKEGEIGRGGAGRGGEPVRPFYRRGKVGLARIF
jgi:hypothetical protein